MPAPAVLGFAVGNYFFLRGVWRGNAAASAAGYCHQEGVNLQLIFSLGREMRASSRVGMKGFQCCCVGNPMQLRCERQARLLCFPRGNPNRILPGAIPPLAANSVPVGNCCPGRQREAAVAVTAQLPCKCFIHSLGGNPHLQFSGFSYFSI